MKNESDAVRLWAAADALKFAPHEAELVLVELAGNPRGVSGFDARMILQEWRQGRLNDDT
jgi:hypothetical protein